MKLSEPIWHDAKNASILKLPKIVANQLFANNSLTVEISRACDQQFAVKVIAQNKADMLASEAQELNTKDCVANIRSVLLMCKHTPVVFARTILPLSANKQLALRFDNLGSRSLGNMLHSSPDTICHPTQVTRLTCGHYLYNFIVKNTQVELNNPIYARRNTYIFNQQKLLVNEVYLPKYWELSI